MFVDRFNNFVKKLSNTAAEEEIVGKNQPKKNVAFFQLFCSYFVRSPSVATSCGFGVALS